MCEQNLIYVLERHMAALKVTLNLILLYFSSGPPSHLTLSCLIMMYFLSLTHVINVTHT